MTFYPPPGSQPHSVHSPLPSVTAYPASPYSSSCRSRRHSTSSFPSYPPVPLDNANSGLNPYPQIPHGYGQGYSGVPTRISTSHNANSGLNSCPQIPHQYGQGYSGVPTRTSTSHNANSGLNSYPQIPHRYGQGYSGVPTRTSTSYNGQVPGPIPQQPQPVHQTQVLPYFGNPYTPPTNSSTAIQAPGRTMGQDITPYYNYQGNQSYYPTQESQVGQPQFIVVKMDGGGRRRRRHHHRRRSSSY